MLIGTLVRQTLEVQDSHGDSAGKIEFDFSKNEVMTVDNAESHRITGLRLNADFGVKITSYSEIKMTDSPQTGMYLPKIHF